MAWNENHIRNDIVELKKLYNKETNINRKIELATYIMVLEETISYFSFENKAKIVGQGNFLKTLYSLPNYRVYLPHIKEFINILNNHKIYKEEIHEISKNDYTDQDMFDLTNDFYKEIGGSAYDKYLEVYKDRKNINYSYQSSADSRTYVIPGLNKFYIDLGSNSDDRDIIEAFIHEVGHVITFKQNENRYHSRDRFIEIESLFYETLGDDFLYRKTKDIYFKDLEKDRIDKYFNCANMIDIMDMAYNTVMDNSLHVKKPEKIFNKMCKMEGLIKPQNVDIDSTMKYTFSYICALELVELYKQDKEKTLYLLNNIISENKNIEEYEKITNNITPCEHLNGYVKTLKGNK